MPSSSIRAGEASAGPQFCSKKSKVATFHWRSISTAPTTAWKRRSDAREPPGVSKRSRPGSVHSRNRNHLVRSASSGARSGSSPRCFEFPRGPFDPARARTWCDSSNEMRSICDGFRFSSAGLSMEIPRPWTAVSPRSNPAPPEGMAGTSLSRACTPSTRMIAASPNRRVTTSACIDRSCSGRRPSPCTGTCITTAPPTGGVGRRSASPCRSRSSSGANPAFLTPPPPHFRPESANF